MDQAFYQELLNSLARGVYFVDQDHKVTYWNKAVKQWSGFTPQEVLGKGCSDNTLRHVDDVGTELCLQGCPLTGTMTDGRMRDMEVFMHHKSGHRVPVLVRATPMHDEQGRIVGAVEIFSNNSRQINVLKEMEELRKEVFSDKLTGVGNRRYADLTLENYERTLQDNTVPFGVVFVDIDHFKKVNDTWGHAAGDLVLRMVAQTLSNSLRALDVACRWGWRGVRDHRPKRDRGSPDHPGRKTAHVGRAQLAGPRWNAPCRHSFVWGRGGQVWRDHRVRGGQG